MAQFVEYYIDQYTDFSTQITLTDSRTNDTVNASGYVVRSQMRRSYYSANASANLTCTLTDAPNGVVTLSLTANQTGSLKSGRYYFDVITTNAANTSSRILEGIMTVTPTVTQS